jgi:hypothetical protein
VGEAAISQNVRTAILCLCAGELGAIAYLNALGNPFVYDDLVTVVGNRSLADPHVREVMRAALFRPVVNASYALDRTLWGLAPFGFHLTNLALHVVNVMLLFGVARIAVADWQARDPEQRATWSTNAVAFAVAALFAVHPMMTEAVGYVSGRSELLVATFFLLGMIAFRTAIVRGGAAWIAFGGLAMALGAGAKETGMMLPFVLLAYDRLLIGGAADAARRRVWRIHAPLVGVVLVLGIARLVTFFQAEPSAPIRPAEYLASQPGVVWRYLGLMVAPVSQSIAHSVPEITSLFSVRVVVPTFALGALAGLAFRIRRQVPLAVVGLAWFFLLLAPSSLVPLNEPMAEHRVYLASAGCFLVVGAGFGSVFRLASPRRALALVGLAIVIVTLGASTVARNRVWADQLTLWGDAVHKAPDSWRAQFSFANALGAAGRCDEAIAIFEEAARLSPPGERGQILMNLGTCHGLRGRLAEAARAYARAVAVKPRYLPPHVNLGLVRLQEGDRDAAHREFLQAVNGDPVLGEWRRLVISIHEAQFREPARTLELCREVQRLAPTTPGVAECIRRNDGRH